MARPTTKLKNELVELIKQMPHCDFINEHGERFTVYCNGVTAFLAGDEVDMMVEPEGKLGTIMPLFNNYFNIWSKDELYKLGQVLMELNK